MAQNMHDPGTSAATMNPPFASSSSGAEPEGASKNLKALVVGSIGVVFGDIGTSPLYTLQETFGGPHGLGNEPEKVLGGVSLTLWTLMALVTLKYVSIIMRADNRGEGGSIALFALVMELTKKGKLASSAPKAARLTCKTLSRAADRFKSDRLLGNGWLPLARASREIPSSVNYRQLADIACRFSHFLGGALQA